VDVALGLRVAAQGAQAPCDGLVCRDDEARLAGRAEVLSRIKAVAAAQAECTNTTPVETCAKSLPFATPLQEWAWEDDTEDAITKTFRRLSERIEASSARSRGLMPRSLEEAAQAHRRWWRVISGGQLNRTGTMDDPTPTDV
jgi:hypothetical protein